MEIKQMLIDPSYKKTRPGTAMNPQYITVHETGNTNKGANALAHAKLQARGNDRIASWHYTVDDGDIIYQSIPDNEISWHSRNVSGNHTSLSLEICVNEDGDFEKAKDNAVWLIRYLMDKHSIPIDKIRTHKWWSGKDCPHNILKSGWDAFVLKVKGASDASNPPFNGITLKRGSNSCEVKLAQLKLGRLKVDGIYGTQTQERVKDFQRAQGIVVDGIIGVVTWGKLFG